MIWVTIQVLPVCEDYAEWIRELQAEVSISPCSALLIMVHASTHDSSSKPISNDPEPPTFARILQTGIKQIVPARTFHLCLSGLSYNSILRCTNWTFDLHVVLDIDSLWYI